MRSGAMSIMTGTNVFVTTVGKAKSVIIRIIRGRDASASDARLLEITITFGKGVGALAVEPHVIRTIIGDTRHTKRLIRRLRMP